MEVEDGTRSSTVLENEDAGFDTELAQGRTKTASWVEEARVGLYVCGGFISRPGGKKGFDPLHPSTLPLFFFLFFFLLCFVDGSNFLFSFSPMNVMLCRQTDAFCADAMNHLLETILSPSNPHALSTFAQMPPTRLMEVVEELHSTFSESNTILLPKHTSSSEFARYLVREGLMEEAFFTVDLGKVRIWEN